MLKFYVISTVFSFLILLINGASVESKLKREGYKRSFNLTSAEKLRNYMLSVIPILNILLAIVSIFCYDKVIAKAKETSWIKEERK